jgi:outer membrane protein assembly factor BamA
MGFFLNKEQTGGIFPVLSFGGNTGAAGGVMAFHNNLFDRRKKINLSLLFGSSKDNSAELNYSDKSFFGSSIRFDLSGKYFNDSDENHFGANQSSEDDEMSYAIEEWATIVNLGYGVEDRLDFRMNTGYRGVDISKGRGKGADIFPTSIPGFGTTNYWIVGSWIRFDFRDAWPRTLSGFLVNLGYQYQSDFDDNRFKFHRYTAEVQTFVPASFLEKNRRFGARIALDKVEPVSEKQIPFYGLAVLGDAGNLRGFDQNRFRATGSLLLNLEYRYPIWDTWDAVIFLDEGQVFDKYSDVRLDEFHWGAGFGFRFMTRTGFLLRTEIGFSREAVRALFQLKPNF